MQISAPVTPTAEDREKNGHDFVWEVYGRRKQLQIYEHQTHWVMLAETVKARFYQLEDCGIDSRFATFLLHRLSFF